MQMRGDLLGSQLFASQCTLHDETILHMLHHMSQELLLFQDAKEQQALILDPGYGHVDNDQHI